MGTTMRIRTIARHDTFEIPREFETSEGWQLPKATYDLALFECGDRYYLKLTNREAGGSMMRVAVQTTGHLDDGESHASQASRFSLLLSRGERALRFTDGSFAATCPLHEPRNHS